jgi:NAD(P)-dependent dehydrogenase (short-subunit alcohol dehydrogenase family)
VAISIVNRGKSMKGKTILFTGASRGMGRFAAIELARRGAEILVVGHHQARGAAAVEAIRGIGGSADFLRADMGDAAEVRAVAEAVLARSGSIDVLIYRARAACRRAARARARASTAASRRTSWARSFSRAFSKSASSPARRRA